MMAIGSRSDRNASVLCGETREGGSVRIRAVGSGAHGAWSDCGDACGRGLGAVWVGSGAIMMDHLVQRRRWPEMPSSFVSHWRQGAPTDCQSDRFERRCASRPDARPAARLKVGGEQCEE